MTDKLDNNTNKSTIFCLDKSNNCNLKQCLNDYSTRLFHDGKCLVKSLRLIENNASLPLAVILTGDVYSIRETLSQWEIDSIRILIFCQNSTRQIYECVMCQSSSIVGLFTRIDDLKDALDEIVHQQSSEHVLIRFISDHPCEYFWYDLLKQTAMRMSSTSMTSDVDLKIINQRLEIDPLISLYEYRSSIDQKCSTPKIFFGHVIKKRLLEQLQLNVNKLIIFHSFAYLQGQHRTLDARHQSLQCCSRRHDEVSVIFELESADQSVFKIIRIFNADIDHQLWIIQLIGTNECEEASKQFQQMKRQSSLQTYWDQPEILFALVLLEMNQIDKCYQYLFQCLTRDYQQFDPIEHVLQNRWKQHYQYLQVIDRFAFELRKIKFSSLSKSEDDLNQHRELTYLVSEIPTAWESPVPAQELQNTNVLLHPIFYRVDQTLFGKPIDKKMKNVSTSQCCTMM